MAQVNCATQQQSQIKRNYQRLDMPHYHLGTNESTAAITARNKNTCENVIVGCMTVTETMKRIQVMSASMTILAFLALPVHAQPLVQPPDEGQVIRNDSGGMFMEEVVESKPKPRTNRNSDHPYGLRKPRGGQDLLLDLSNVGVKVDPTGKIVPLLQNGAPPGDVQPFFSETTVTRESPYPYYYGPNAGVGWGPPVVQYSPGPYGYRPIARSYYPRWGNGLNPYWSRQQVQGWQYVAPRAVSPVYTPYGAVRYTGSSFNYPFGQSAGVGLGSRHGYLWLPNVTQYQSTSTIRPLFGGMASP